MGPASGWPSRSGIPPFHALSNISKAAPAEFTTADTPVKQNGVPVPQDTPQQQQGTTTIAHSHSQNFSTPTVNPPIPPTTNFTIPATAASIPAPNTTSTNSNSNNNASVEAQLVEAKAQIAALTKQLEITGSGLRQRNVTQESHRPASSSAREVVQAAAEQGVPVKIVAYLCLAAFLLAYLFF
jgi:hypothetical protein